MDQALLFWVVWDIAPVTGLRLVPRPAERLFRDAKARQEMGQVVIKVETLGVVKNGRHLRWRGADIYLFPQHLDGERFARAAGIFAM